ncbi:CBS domain containing protein [Zostera marina]|uniref:CBS domain containing protein n=1 Tax=Zostera marina TaxID=29655 RepID=A0A0K9NWS3_ZOSMR|nr:CBS domain containing protein [Zostera marina]
MEGDKGAGGGGSGQLPSSYPFSSPTHSAVSGSSYRRSISKKIPADTNSIDTYPSERTVKRLRLSKALTIPENTTVQEACRRMTSRKVDALLLTSSNALLCGILTDKDVATRVIANELNLEETPVSKVMTKNPVFVLSDTLAVDALQKMIQGKFRHLPVVENGEVIAILDIAKCLYDAICRMERISEKSREIEASADEVGKGWGRSMSGRSTFMETIRERMFRPCLSAIVTDNPKVVTISPSESVLAATKKMSEHEVSSTVVTFGKKLQGILTSKDILMRVIAENLPPKTTIVDQVMTKNPGCGSVDTPIVEALQIMQNGKFLHLPVVDRDMNIVSVVDVLAVTNAAIATVGNNGSLGNASIVQKFWDSTLDLAPGDGDDCDGTQSFASMKLESEVMNYGRYDSYPSPSPGLLNFFSFKLENRKGQMHRFMCDSKSLTELITSILERIGDDIDRNHLPHILYEDEDHDKVILTSDSDLEAAVEHAKLAGWKGLRLHLDYSGTKTHCEDRLKYSQNNAWPGTYNTLSVGAAFIAGLSVMTLLKRYGPYSQ